MRPMLDESKPIFQQIKEYIEDEIIDGGFKEGTRIPSTNEFANHYQINPATAAKGVNILVDEGILFKKRGTGMFVAQGARNKLRERRRQLFPQKYIQKMLKEAERLGIKTSEIIEMMGKEGGTHGDAGY